MLFSIGFLFAFLMGGVTGVMLAVAPDRLLHPRHLLRGGPLPPGAVRHRGLRRLRRALLLVSEDVRPDARRDAWASWHFWLTVHRLLAHLHAPVHRRSEGHAPAGGQLPHRPRLADLQQHLDHRRLHHRRLVPVLLWSTSWSPGATRCRPATTRGTPTPSSGSPPRPRPTTTTPTCRRSARSGPTWDYNHPDAPGPQARAPGRRRSQQRARRRRDGDGKEKAAGHEDRGAASCSASASSSAASA